MSSPAEFGLSLQTPLLRPPRTATERISINKQLVLGVFVRLLRRLEHFPSIFIATVHFCSSWPVWIGTEYAKMDAWLHNFLREISHSHTKLSVGESERETGVKDARREKEIIIQQAFSMPFFIPNSFS